MVEMGKIPMFKACKHSCHQDGCILCNDSITRYPLNLGLITFSDRVWLKWGVHVCLVLRQLRIIRYQFGYLAHFRKISFQVVITTLMVTWTLSTSQRIVIMITLLWHKCGKSNVELFRSNILSPCSSQLWKITVLLLNLLN